MLAAMTPVTSEHYKKNPEVELDEEGGCIIAPDPGFVLKCHEMEGEGKVFVNVCHHP